jgi:hypothetical protein
VAVEAICVAPLRAYTVTLAEINMDNVCNIYEIHKALIVRNYAMKRSDHAIELQCAKPEVLK